MSDAWQEAVQRALAARPGVDPAAFGVHAEACRARGARSDHAEELLLAWSAGRGDAGALRELERAIAAEGEVAARRIDRAPAFIDEVRQALRVRLLVAEAGRVRIDDYAGRGPLRGWIGVAALRVALNLVRRVAPASPDLLGELVTGEADPELQHLKTLYRAEFREALEVSLQALPERARTVLRLSYVDGVKHVQLGRLYGVHETTAARWVAQAAADVAEATRTRLMTRLALSPASMDSVTRMVLSNLDLSIGRILRG